MNWVFYKKILLKIIFFFLEESSNEVSPKLNVKSCIMRSYYEKRTLPAKDSNLCTLFKDDQIAFADDIDDEELENRLMKVQENSHSSKGL